MQFNSLAFFIFLMPVFLIFFFTPKKIKPYILLAASIIFYLECDSPYSLAIILALAAFDFLISHLVAAYTQKNIRVGLIILSVLVNLGSLIYFKYTNYIFSSIFSMKLSIVAPIGISYFIFMKLGYLIEVYRKPEHLEKNPLIFLLYCIFYPVILSGPIERSKRMLPQFHNLSKPTYADITLGSKLFAIGMLKKMVIADRAAIYVNSVYSNLYNQTPQAILIASILFMLQLYMDFSGYSLMAVGIARIFGIDVMNNFNHPYLSRTIGEFWRRWHISLSSWFKDYLYIPLGGNRVPKYRVYINLFLVFLASGAWHGANVTYIFWGAWHGLFICLEKSPARKGVQKIASTLRFTKDRYLYAFLNWIYASTVVFIGWIFFRASSMKDAFFVLKQIPKAFMQPGLISGLRGALVNPAISSLTGFDFKVIILTSLLVFLCEFLSEKYGDIYGIIYRRHAIVSWSIYVVVILFIALFGYYGCVEQSSFLYGKF